MKLKDFINEMQSKEQEVFYRGLVKGYNRELLHNLLSGTKINYVIFRNAVANWPNFDKKDATDYINKFFPADVKLKKILVKTKRK